ncbi:LysR substrate-binding domain-containing protein [Taibaiella soli]|uniref:LysR family transcriptional regulator n=1 Tax=Taibaiella soli TaxID=1649169 RepID=A0A2W2ABG2_9BACT|nr:LysR substrate-binding domain-containing protein [Taibaiella soli]PZF72651.1 LysR family transcriptional regulator [Taibaiella soli]
MELRQLRYFLKAKELLNFTEAAHALNISQSTLSQQIKQLEDQIRVPLFNRIGKRISLTEAGTLFAEYALQSVNRADDGLLLLEDLNNLKTGKINIGVTFALRNVLTKTLILFAQQYPKVKVCIVFGTSDELIEKLSAAELDLVLTFKEDSKDTQFRQELLFSSPLTLVAAERTGLASRRSISLEEITRLPLALPATGYSTTRFITEAFKRKGLHPDVSIEINDIPTLLAIVKTGSWHTILTKVSVVDQDLITIPIEGKKMSRSAMAIWLNDAYPKKAMLAFLKLLKAENNL